MFFFFLGINFEKYEHVNGTVTGTDAPHRIETFEESGLRRILLDNVKRSGYLNPTPGTLIFRVVSVIFEDEKKSLDMLCTLLS